MAKHIEVGFLGEDLAKEFLENKQYQILETNWRFGQIELDLIAMDGDILVFVEVKTRSSNVIAEPYMSVHRKKMRRIVRAASEYAIQIGHNWEVRFDVLSIVLSTNPPSIQHIEDAFYPSW